MTHFDAKLLWLIEVGKQCFRLPFSPPPLKKSFIKIQVQLTKNINDAYSSHHTILFVPSLFHSHHLFWFVGKKRRDKRNEKSETKRMNDAFCEVWRVCWAVVGGGCAAAASAFLGFLNISPFFRSFVRRFVYFCRRNDERMPWDKKWMNGWNESLQK